MNDLVYPNERKLGAITLVLGLLAWLALLVGTFGGALIGLAIGFLLYLFAQSALIAYIRGNGVELSEAQFPDLYAQFAACCDRLQIERRPQAYILNGNGGLNAFATKFLGTQFVVLMSDVVDAMSKHTDGVRFYLGHELGHLRMKHLSGHLLRWPVLWLPLLGAAYSRARESTCDRHGLACSSSPEGAARALAALSAGSERWQDLDVRAYLHQTRHSSGFWMSFHELVAGYPWLTKRAARVVDPNAPLPKRNGLAYLPAMFIPFAGRLGAGFGFLVLVYVVFILAAIAVPAYRDYTVRAQAGVAVSGALPALDALGDYYEANKTVPDSLDDAGIASTRSGGAELALDTENMELTLLVGKGEIVFTPTLDDEGNVSWTCTNGEGITPAQLPPACKNMGH
jgi:Zn-dependent protease with chaperone function